MLFYYAQFVAFAFGIVWCGAILKRLPSDVRDYREADGGATRAVLVTYWVVTALIALWVVGFALGLLAGF